MGGLRRLLAQREAGTALLLALAVMLAAARAPRFLDAQNVQSVLVLLPLLIIVATGETLVIVIRGIDVSVGSMVGLSAVACGLAYKDFSGVNVWVGVAVACLVGAGLGCVNAGLVTWLRIPPIIATLAGLSAYRGLAYVLVGGGQIDADRIPDSVTAMSVHGPFAVGGVVVPWIAVIGLMVAALAEIVLRWSRWGRGLYAVGGNAAAAEAHGIRVGRVSFAAYVLCGLLAGVGGVVYVSQFGFVAPATAGSGLELTAIAAAVIGGVDVFGGSGTVIGVVFGCALVSVIHVALAVLGIAETWQMLAYGAVILAAVLLDGALRARRPAGAH